MNENMDNKNSVTPVAEEKTTPAPEGKKSAKAAVRRMTVNQRKLLNAVFIAVVVLVFIAVNVLAVFLVNKFPQTEVDLTGTGSYSLQDTTAEYLGYLKDDISVKVLMTEDELLAVADESGSGYTYQVNQLLKKMSTYDRVTLEYVDLSAASTKVFTEKYPNADWTSKSNLLLVECGSKYKVISLYDVFTYNQEYYSYYGVMYMEGQTLEQAVLSAVQRVTSDKVPVVALSVGNGEFVNEESEMYQYYSYISVILDDNAYEVKTVNLLTEQPDENTDFIVLLAPSYDLTDSAVDALSQWLTNGGDYGKTLVYVPSDKADDTPNLDLFLEQWGMKVTDGFIYENDLTKTAAAQTDSQLYAFSDYSNDTYTEGLKTKTKDILMPYCMPVEILDDTMAKPLLTSSDSASILKLNQTDPDNREFIESTGKALNSAAIATKTNDGNEASNIVVWGSYDALSTSALYQGSANYNNAEYFVNIFNTLSGNDSESIVLEGRTLTSEKISVNSAQQITVLVIFVVLLPTAVFVLGIIIWVRRRNR